MIGRVICKLRYQHGWTQEQLAVQMQINGCDMSRHVVANIESARSEPTYQQLKFFARIFKVPVSTFFSSDLQETETYEEPRPLLFRQRQWSPPNPGLNSK